MPDTVTIRLNKEEKKMFEDAAKMYNCSMSSMIKRLAIEKIEDEIDLEAINEYEKAVKNKTEELRPLSELWSELGLDE